MPRWHLNARALAQSSYGLISENYWKFIGLPISPESSNGSLIRDGTFLPQWVWRLQMIYKINVSRSEQQVFSKNEAIAFSRGYCDNNSLISRFIIRNTKKLER